MQKSFRLSSYDITKCISNNWVFTKGQRRSCQLNLMVLGNKNTQQCRDIWARYCKVLIQKDDGTNHHTVWNPGYEFSLCEPLQACQKGQHFFAENGGAEFIIMYCEGPGTGESGQDGWNRYLGYNLLMGQAFWIWWYEFSSF